MKHSLPSTTEQHLQREIQAFDCAVELYRESLWTLQKKKEGHFHQFPQEAIEVCVREHFEDAYNKIPSIWLEELLNQNPIAKWKKK